MYSFQLYALKCSFLKAKKILLKTGSGTLLLEPSTQYRHSCYARNPKNCSRPQTYTPIASFQACVHVYFIVVFWRL